MKLGAEVYLNSNVAAFIAVEGAQLCSFTFWQRAHRHLVDKKKKKIWFFFFLFVYGHRLFFWWVFGDLLGLWGLMLCPSQGLIWAKTRLPLFSYGARHGPKTMHKHYDWTVVIVYMWIMWDTSSIYVEFMEPDKQVCDHFLFSVNFYLTLFCVLGRVTSLPTGIS